MPWLVELSKEVGGTHKVTIDNDKVLETKTIIIATPTYLLVGIGLHMTGIEITEQTDFLTNRSIRNLMFPLKLIVSLDRQSSIQISKSKGQ